MMKRKANRWLRLIALALACLTLASCGAKPQGNASAGILPTASAAERPDPNVKTSGVGFYFDTVVTVTLWGAPEGLMEQIWAECTRYEQMLSKTIVTSDVGRINAAAGKPVTVHPETWAILQKAKEISALSGGAFSITIAPVTALWSFTGMTTNTVPTDEARLAAVALVDDQQIILGDNYTVTIPVGMQIDLGGIAKGYIADKVADLIRHQAYAGIVSLGGNVYTVGQKPNGDPFSVGIADPNHSSQYMAIIYTGDGTVVTSGTYERGFSFGGVRLHHILDPETGWPAQSDLLSATFVMKSSMEADAMATACIVLGSEKALELANSQGLDAVFIKTDGTVLFTDGFAEKYNYRTP